MSGEPIVLAQPGKGLRLGNYRWLICALLFFATTINYVDRSVLSVLSSELRTKISGWDEVKYGYINAAFSGAYALGLLVAGGLIDRFGTRLGYAAALFLWSMASIAHALVHTVFGFGVARVALGLAEAGNFPAAVKTVAEWFPRRERSLAIGVFNSGTNIGAILAPVIVPWITITWGWRAAFVATGAAGLIWLLFWIPIYRRPREHRRVSPRELAHIHSDPEEPITPIAWAHLFPHRQTWAFGIAKLLTDPIWWLWLFWAAPFFDRNFHVSIKTIGPPLIVIYNMATIGSIGGGWISSSLIRAGWSVNAGRKTALLICALCVLPVMVTPLTHHLWVAVALIGLAAAAHQGFSANLFTLSSDLFPRRAVGSVVGIGGMLGGLANIILQIFAGRIVKARGYLLLFIIAGCAYLLAVLVIQILSPNLEPAMIEASAGS